MRRSSRRSGNLKRVSTGEKGIFWRRAHVKILRDIAQDCTQSRGFTFLSRKIKPGLEWSAAHHLKARVVRRSRDRAAATGAGAFGTSIILEPEVSSYVKNIYINI